MHSYIEQKIESRKSHHKPFDHFIITDFLPPLLYKKILNEIKNIDFHKHKSSSVSNKRTVFYLKTKGQSESLNYLYEHINSPDFAKLISNNLLDKKTSDKLLNKELYFEIQLIEDLCGYSIPPHCDTYEKNKHKHLTLLLYLPDTLIDRHYGTELYEQNNQDKTIMHLEKTIPYVPNLLFGFVPVVNHTWHGRRPIKKNIIRHSIQIFLKNKGIL